MKKEQLADGRYEVWSEWSDLHPLTAQESTGDFTSKQSPALPLGEPELPAGEHLLYADQLGSVEADEVENEGSSESGGEESEESDAFRHYLREIGRVPLLSAEEEVRLARLIERGRQERMLAEREKITPDRRPLEEGEEAQRRLTEANLRLVVSIARRYQPMARTMDLLDLIQEGNIGLMRAVEKFDHRKGYRFSTYATWWIRQTILRGLADKDRTIRIPSHYVATLHHYARVCERLVHECGREPAEQEIADAMGLSCEKVRELARVADPISLHTPVGTGYRETELGDFLPDPHSNPADEAMNAVLREQVRAVLSTLSEREQTILALRFGLDGGRRHTLEEVGHQLGVTRERIRQIEARALRKLQQPNRSRLLKNALDGLDG